MNWRSKMILNDYIRAFNNQGHITEQITPDEGLGLLGLFNQYRVYSPQQRATNPNLSDGHLAGNPIELKTVAPAFSLSVKSKSENLPAVSFGFGNNRGLETGTTEGISGRFNIYVYAEVNKTTDKTIIERAGDMYSCVEEVVIELRTFCPVGVDIQNVRIADMRTPETKLSEKEFMLFVLSVEFEEFFDEVI